MSMAEHYKPATVETTHRCSGCGVSYLQRVGESAVQADDRHDDSPEGYRAHVAAGMPTGPSLESMDDVEADDWA